MKKENLIKKFDKQADMYERNRRALSLSMWRKKLLSQAEGDVLELAVGAGANFPFYNRNVTHITGVDFSPRMIQKAQMAAHETGMASTLLKADVETQTFPENSFDTLVSTFSLCGYDNPITVLKNMKRWCKPNGKILLMEHGISSNGPLSVLQWGIDPFAFHITGCHYQRNILKLIKEAGIRIQQKERHWAGIIYLVHAQPH